MSGYAQATRKAEPKAAPGGSDCGCHESTDSAVGVPRFLSGLIQPRLVVGAASDAFEREADAVADAVQRDEPVAVAAGTAGVRVQRMCAECLEERLTEEEDLPPGGAGFVQRLAGDPGGTLSSGSDGGDALDGGVRTRLEGSLGAGLGDVRVHRGPTAGWLTRALGARAFTHGAHVWLGARERPDDLGLMAHEVTHVLQQSSGRAGPGRIQRAPADYRHPEDGGGVAGRMQARIAEADDTDAENPPSAHDARNATQQIDRGELATERGGLEPDAKPDVDRPAAEAPKVQEAQAQTEQEADSPAEPIAEGEAATPEGGEGEEAAAGEAAAAAGAAAAVATAPGPEAAVLPPASVAPVDAGGQALPANPEADLRIAAIAGAVQGLRTEGTRVRGFAAEERNNAQALSGNLAIVGTGLEQAETGVATSNEHLAFRQELVGQAREALTVSEEKAATVAAEAPEYSSKADEGKAESGPMASEAQATASENAANTPSDSEAAAKAQEQGGKMNQAASDIGTTDDAISQTRTKAGDLAADAAQAQETNTATRGKLDATDATLAATGDKLTQMSAQNTQARVQMQALSTAPQQQTQQALAVDRRGESLVGASFDIEARLHAVQREYEASMRAVPAAEEPEPEAAEAPPAADHASVEDFVVQRTPDASAPASDLPAIEPPAPDAAVETAPADSDENAGAGAGAGAGDAGAGDGAEPPLDLAPEEAEAAPPPELPQRETVDATGAVTGALPSWLTGVEAPNEQQRQESAAAAEQRRADQIAEIEAEAGGRFEDLSATDKMGIALRMTGRNLFGSVGNIQWPGWGHLALGLIDPRGPLMGVVSGLGMMLGGAANLFSAEQWSRDPLGNLLKSAADIATGLTIILGSITALAGVVIAIMTAITILSFGTAAPITGPVIAFCTTVLTTVGGWTIAVGKVALVLQALVLIKNLIDAACAQTAAELQSEADQMTENVSDAGNVLMQMGMAKAGQLGGRAATAEIQAAGGGVRYAAQMGARAGVGARSGLAAVGRGARALPGAAGRGLRALPGAVGRGLRALPGAAASGARAVGRGVVAGGRALGRGAVATSRAIGSGARSAAGAIARTARAAPGAILRGARGLPGVALRGIRGIPGALGRGARSAWAGVRGFPGRLRESFGRGLSREFLVGEDIANLGMARGASAEARAAVWAEARAPGGALAGEARVAGAADDVADVRPGSTADSIDVADLPPERPAAREASIAESGQLENDALSPRQIRNEVDELRASPDALEGTAPNRRARIGEHEWRERPDGAGFCRFSPTRICVDTPEMRAEHVAQSEARVAELEADASARAARAQEAQQRAAGQADVAAGDRAMLEQEIADAEARMASARTRARVEKGRATRLERAGKADEAAAARTQAGAAEREAAAAAGDARSARELLDEPAAAARAAEETQQAASAASNEAKAAAESLQRQRALAQRLDDIDVQERALLRENRFGEPPMASEAGNRLRLLREERQRLRTTLAGEVEAATGLTPEVRASLRSGTPFKGAGGTERQRAFLEGVPDELRGPNGTYVDYVTGELRPLSELSPDHIVPVDEIFGMEGFGRLSRADQLDILDLPDNLGLLERSLNESKRATPLSQWVGSDAPLAPGVTPAQRQAFAATEARARAALEAEIARRLARMRAQ